MKPHKLRRHNIYGKQKKPVFKIIIIGLVVVFCALIVASLWHNKQSYGSLTGLPPETANKTPAQPAGYDKIPPYNKDDAPLLPITHYIYNERSEYSYKVAQTDPVDNDYFSDCLFIGDSTTMLYKNYLSTVYPDLKIIASEDLSVKSAVESLSQGLPGNIAEEVALYSDIKRIYISLGCNDLSFSAEEFGENYSALVLALRKVMPKATVYLQPIIPTAAYYQPGLKGADNSKIAAFNNVIMETAKALSIHYIDTAAAFVTPSGALSEDFTVDGLHLTGKGFYIMFDYIKKHTVPN